MNALKLFSEENMGETLLMIKSIPQGANILDVDLTNPENSIFIPVNCAGVMGKGLALDFKKKYPEMFEVYRNICNKHFLRVGFPDIIYFENSLGSAVLFPTKNDWRKPSELHWIKQGLLELAASVDSDYSSWRRSTTYIHIPKLGCGLGGLEWADVRPLIEQFSEMMPDHEVYLYG